MFRGSQKTTLMRPEGINFDDLTERGYVLKDGETYTLKSGKRAVRVNGYLKLHLGFSYGDVPHLDHPATFPVPWEPDSNVQAFVVAHGTIETPLRRRSRYSFDVQGPDPGELLVVDILDCAIKWTDQWLFLKEKVEMSVIVRVTRFTK